MTKSIVIISGKGGTGKTSVTGAFAVLAKDAVLADCDVDAPDLHLILSPKIKHEEEFISGKTAIIDPEKCTSCGKCKEACVFDAISESFVVDPVSCEGCGVCAFVCPENAAIMKPADCGVWFISDTRAGPMAHACLHPGKENSGKLVSLVRTKALEVAKEKGLKLIIIDGPPGIGCPVIASIGGNDLAVIVTEPTLSGLSDLKRVVALAAHFKIPAAVVINKYNINEEISNQIKDYCGDNNVSALGTITYDAIMTKAQLEAKSVVEYGENTIANEIRDIWQKLQDHPALK